MQSVRGMQDVFGNEQDKFLFIVSSAKNIAKRYGFFELQTPIVEFAGLFERNLGEESDVIQKEIYKFKDRGENELALRPEFTAGVVRSYMENNFKNPCKAFSYGSLFRYDRPQKGRYGQFNQVNFEVFGKGTLLEDVEALLVGYNFLQSLNLSGNFQLEINTLGSAETLKKYSNVLSEYFKDKTISDLSKKGLLKNPLRILDSKEEADKEASVNAPKISSCYSKEEAERFEKLCEMLKSLNIPFIVNEKIVRGLDYYTGIVFEFTTTELGSQSTILGGGRYDNLVAQMGGKETPAIGFAAGIERLFLLINNKQNLQKALFILPFKEENMLQAISLAEQIRNEGITTFVLDEGSVSKRLERASKEAFENFAIVVGEKELQSSVFKIKNLTQSKEEEGDLKYIISCLK